MCMIKMNQISHVYFNQYEIIVGFCLSHEVKLIIKFMNVGGK